MNAAQKWYVKGGAYRLNRNPEAMDTEEQKMAHSFVKMFDKITPTDRALRLYRGVGNGTYQNQVGHYWSTSSSEGIAKSFTREELYQDVHGNLRARAIGEVLIIDVQPGVRVMHIGGVQQEYVIEREIEVTETNRVENGVVWVWITVSPKS